MDDKKVLELTENIKTTLGEENYATISDSIGEILTGNSLNMKAISERDESIKKLEEKNEKLVAANGALLQKVPMMKSSEADVKEDSKPAPKINLKEAFDAKGNFVK